MQNREYVIPAPETANSSTLRAVVDHYHKVVYCEIPKVASTSWAKLFKKLAAKEMDSRKQWFAEHPYPWMTFKVNSRYRYVFKLSCSTKSSSHNVWTEFPWHNVSSP